ncbi:MAG: hypothetical protein JWM33_418, partial [Caulobacteraceae bacterium]|nr:hypothetical protein [Caulobacteraceae bacterium]
AVRTQAALEQQGAAMAGGAFEALSLAAVLCDAGGRVRAVTAAARQLIESEGGLIMQDGWVQSTSEAKALREAIAQVGKWFSGLGSAQPAGVSNRELLLKGRTGMVLADIAPLPRQPWALGTGASVVIILKRQVEAGATLTLSRRAQGALRAAYGLTEAEGQVATLLAQGSTRAEVAAARRVSLETVRVQSRAIFDKCGVGRQTELMALAAQL